MNKQTEMRVIASSLSASLEDTLGNDFQDERLDIRRGNEITTPPVMHNIVRLKDVIDLKSSFAKIDLNEPKFATDES